MTDPSVSAPPDIDLTMDVPLGANDHPNMDEAHSDNTLESVDSSTGSISSQELFDQAEERLYELQEELVCLPEDIAWEAHKRLSSVLCDIEDCDLPNLEKNYVKMGKAFAILDEEFAQLKQDFEDTMKAYAKFQAAMGKLIEPGAPLGGEDASRVDEAKAKRIKDLVAMRRTQRQMEKNFE